MKNTKKILILLASLIIPSCATSSKTRGVEVNNGQYTYTNNNDTTTSKTWDVDYAQLTNTITTETMRAIVTIETTSYDTNFLGFTTGGKVGTGSGFVAYKSTDGYYCITNNHVAVKNKQYSKVKHTVTDYLGNEHQAVLVDASPSYDLAIIYFSKDNVELNDIHTYRTNDLESGEPVVSLGQPKRQTNSITFGKVTAYIDAPKMSNAEAYESNVTFKVMRHDAKIAPGSSGGPVLDTNLRIAGVNYAGGTEDENGFDTVCGAIPAYRVLEYWNDWVSRDNASTSKI